jgi:hypothetical protein
VSDEQTIEIGIEEDGEVHRLTGIPQVAWERFCENAKRQFPKHGDDAWAAYLSEVVVAVSGGDQEKVTYFMTDVPRPYAEAVHRAFAQIGLTWDRFHAYLINAAVKPDNLRLVRFHPKDGEEQKFGTLIVAGVPHEVFAKFEGAVEGKTFEGIVATLFLAAENGTLKFVPEGQFAQAIDLHAPPAEAA